MRGEIVGPLRLGSLGSWTIDGSTHKGCTHRAIISCDCYRWGRQYPTIVIIAQSEHLSFVIFANFDVKKKHLKLLAMAFDQDLTCLIFPLRWACFAIKSSNKKHLFSMDLKV